MKTRSILVLLAMLMMGSLQAQKKVDPSIDIDDLRTEASALNKDELFKLADNWLSALRAKNKEAVTAAKGYKDKSKEKKAVTKEILARQGERLGIENRLNVVISVVRAQGHEEKAKELERLRDPLTKSHVDFKDINALWESAKGWVMSPEGGIRLGLNILAFLVILLIAKVVSNIAAKIISQALRTSRLKISDLLRDFFVNTTRKLIFFGGVIMALGKIGIDTGPLLAGIGVMGFVIGFALQGTLSNFASGVMILLYRPYDIGNVVSAGGATGKVTEMSLVSTTLTTPDNQIVIIPNSSIWGGVITNITGNSTRRVDMTFGIGYDDDIPKAMRILEELATGHELVLKDPAVVVQLHELADSSVNFIVRPWTKTADYWKVYWDMQKAVKERFDQEGISIPYPQQDVHMHEVKSA